MGYCNSIQLLEPKFSMRILLFLRDRPPTSLSEIYDAVSYGTNMPRKLESLRDGGLIIMKPCDRAVYVSLTDDGRCHPNSTISPVSSRTTRLNGVKHNYFLNLTELF